MIFRQLFDPVSCTYTYVLGDEVTRDAVIIDSVFEHHERDAAMIRELGLRLVYAVDTHAHADHVTGAWLMKRAFGASIVLSKRYDAENVDVAVDHGDTLKFGDRTIAVRATPGHTAGCVTYVTADEQLAFTGDCLLIRGAGRTDFQAGDASQMYRSIHDQILSLPDDALLYPGHDYSGRTVTSVAEEKKFNARIGGRASEEDFVGFMNNLGLPHPKKIAIAVPANLRSGRPEAELPDEPGWGPVIMTYAGIPQVPPEWVWSERADLTIVDVRNADETRRAYIEGALVLPLDELRDRLDEIPEDKPVVTFCRSGRRSGQAAVILRKSGRERVANIAGGLLEWEELGLPVVTE